MKLHCPESCQQYHEGPVYSMCDYFSVQLEYSQYKKPIRCEQCREAEMHHLTNEPQKLDFNR